jgi:hypothetical protein
MADIVRRVDRFNDRTEQILQKCIDSTDTVICRKQGSYDGYGFYGAIMQKASGEKYSLTGSYGEDDSKLTAFENIGTYSEGDEDYD